MKSISIKKYLIPILLFLLLLTLIPYGVGANEDFPDLELEHRINPEDIADIQPSQYGYLDWLAEVPSLPGNISGPEAQNLPPSYDSRTLGYVTDVKDQNPYGTCWAFAPISAAESDLIMNHGWPIETDLSELQLVYFTYTDALDPLGLLQGERNKNITDNSIYNVGGNTFIATPVLAKGVGTTDESAAPYTDLIANGPSLTINPDYAYNSNNAIMTNAYWVPMTDHDSIKNLIMTYGSVTISYYAPESSYYNSIYFNSTTNAYYCASSYMGRNHAVTVVGWDDTFATSNFGGQNGTSTTSLPEGPGAWIVKNSWGPIWGDNGYFYLSYYDKSANIDKNAATAYDFEPGNAYQNIYQYDGTTFSAALSSTAEDSDTAYMANVFTAQKNEELVAVSFFTDNVSISYEISIYTWDGATPITKPTSGTLVANQTGRTIHSGYRTVPLEESIFINEGQKFSVVVKIMSEVEEDNVRLPISYATTISNTIQTSIRQANPGESFYSYNNNTWFDVSNSILGKIGCLRVKAFTVPTASKPAIINASPMLSGIYESPYSATLEATSATPVEWEITDGNLPAGLTLNEHTGVISGTPTAIGTSNFIVKATNDADEDIKPFSITITPATPDSPDSLSVTIGDANATLNWHAPTDTGGSNIIKYMVRCEPTQGGSPQIIDNITATSKEITGLNNGTSYSFRVWAFNGKRWSNASTPVIATPGTAPVITSPSTILSVEQGLESSLTITATGKPSPRFSATLANGNALPNWISLNSATGKLTVRPSFYEKTGDTIIRVTATNAVSFATIDFTIRVRTVPKYSLVVTNGTGSGQYEEGEYVTITANSPPADKVFDCWSSTIWPLENKPSITFRMPPKDTTITALYRDAPTFTLYIYYSDGSGTYKPHTKIPIRAYRRYSGPVVFDKWTVEPAEYTHIVSDIYCANATITLPDLDDSQYNEIIVVGATYKDTLPSLRVSGDDRFGTAAAISQVSFVSTETVILVNGLNFPDALAATPLAYELDAPVLMVSGNTIHPETQAELNRLEPKNIIILGGSSAVSQSIENSLKSKYNVTRLSGNNRYGTAEAIANELLRQTKRQQFDTVILAYGLNYPDALGVGPGAALEGCPIIFTDKNNIPAETQRILAKANKVIIVGGSSVVSNAVQKQLTTTHRVTRLSGNSRYDTCIEIQKHFFSDTYNDSIFIATGTNFADALTGGVAAARNQSPIILIDGKASSLPEKTANYIWESSTKKAIVLGGTNAVNRTLEKQIRDLLN